MIDLRAQDLTVRSGEVCLIEAVSFELKPGELVAILGPNGAGKTTLLRAGLGLIVPDAGVSMLAGQNVARLPPIDRARQIAYLPQTRPLAWPNTVRDVVALGRFSHGAVPGRLRGVDADAVARAMAACDITDLAARKVDTLSGGEASRVHCARAFAAEAPLLIADEPVAALDPRHQFRVMDLIAGFVADGGGALVVLHDVALAARYADRLIWLKSGRIVADGSPADTLSVQRLAEIYGVKARVEGLRVEIEGAL